MKKFRRISFLILITVVLLLAGACSKEEVSGELISGEARQRQKNKEYLSGIGSIVYTVPEMKDVRVLVNAEYGNDRYMDVYYPPDYSFDRELPVVVVYNGFAGMNAKDMGRFIDWCLLLSASGFMAVTFDPVYPEKDYPALLDYLAVNASELGADPENLGVLCYCGTCCDGLRAFTIDERPFSEGLRTGIFLYGYMPWSEDIKKDASILMVKTGKSTEQEIKDSMDNFIAMSSAGGPYTELIDYQNGYKYFDISEIKHQPWEYGADKAFTEDCDVLKSVVDFLQSRMLKVDEKV